MWSTLNENPTREKILLLLKKSGPMSIDSLSKALNITSMGIRQHLLSLERKGLIEYITKRQGIGRPAFLYRLTGKAEELWPKTYDAFLLHLLKDVENREGRNRVDEIFKWHRNRILKEAKEALADKQTVHDRVSGLKEFLDAGGHITELHSSNNHYTLQIFNCPIYRIAVDYPEACRHDLQVFRELLGKDLTREGCIVDGNPSCSYTIPINTSR